MPLCLNNLLTNGTLFPNAEPAWSISGNSEPITTSAALPMVVQQSVDTNIPPVRCVLNVILSISP